MGWYTSWLRHDLFSTSSSGSLLLHFCRPVPRCSQTVGLTEHVPLGADEDAVERVHTQVRSFLGRFLSQHACMRFSRTVCMNEYTMDF